MTQQDLFMTPTPSAAPEVAARVELPAGFYEQVVRGAAAHDLASAMVSYARELVRLQAGLSTFEQGALTLLVLATIIEQRRGSTRLPIHALRAPLAQTRADLQGDGGSPRALDAGDSARLLDIIRSLVAPKRPDDGAPDTLVADLLEI